MKMILDHVYRHSLIAFCVLTVTLVATLTWNRWVDYPIAGYVIDGDSREGIEGATVYVADNGGPPDYDHMLRTKTDKNGRYEFRSTKLPYRFMLFYRHPDYGNYMSDPDRLFTKSDLVSLAGSPPGWYVPTNMAAEKWCRSLGPHSIIHGATLNCRRPAVPGK